MAARYDPDRIRRFYDEFGEGEWDRLDADPRARVIFHVHAWHLRQYVRPGDRVLEAGAGPGRFTIELARLGADVTVADISPRQLELNRAKLDGSGLDRQVADRVLLDIVDCSQFPDESFDAVVCYGSPLSYVFDRADDALRELVRATKRGGYLLLSVASMGLFLPAVIDLVRTHGISAVQRVVDTGDWVGPLARGHPMHCYRWSELRALLERHPVEIVATSASDFLSDVPYLPELARLEADPELWAAFLRWELDFCREPGALDCGSHIIAIVRRC